MRAGRTMLPPEEETMTDILNRRNFLTKGALGGAAAVTGASLAAPAIAQELPTLK
jgi:nitrous oxide reductase